MKSILPFFLPSEIVMIDDDEMLLAGWGASFSSLPINLKTFSNPFEGVEFIQNRSEVNAYNSIDSLYLQIFDASRFHRISTVIVDFDMPGLGGLDVCRKISSPYIQKIMLTGAATDSIAIEAFNEGIIHQFLQKSDPELFSKLPSIVTKAQEKYFELVLHDLTNQIYLESPESDILRDPVFIDFFREIISGHKILEYYLLDVTGSFLLLNDKGEAKVLYVFTEEMLEMHEDMILDSDRNSTLAKDVYSRKQAVCFYPFGNHQRYDPVNWKSYLYPLSQLKGGRTYYYAIQSKLSCLDSENICSFRRYLEKL